MDGNSDSDDIHNFLNIFVRKFLSFEVYSGTHKWTY